MSRNYRPFGRVLGSIVLLGLLALFLPGSIADAWSNDPAQNTPICTASGSQGGPRIVSDGSGGAIITWQDYRSGSGHIYAQRVDSGGAVKWATDGVPICTAAGNDQWYPQIVSDGSGGAIITWQDERSDSDDIYAQRVDSGGAVKWATDGVPICTVTDGLGLEYPQVTSDGSGGAIITWEEFYTTGPDNIWAQRVDSSGSVQWAANGVAICTDAGRQSDPRITSDGSGGAIITWEDRSSYGVGNVDAQRVDSTGTFKWRMGIATMAWGPYAAHCQMNPEITSDGSGGAIITWEHYSGYCDVRAQRVDSSGTVQWAFNGVIICSADYDQLGPQITSDGSGGAIITWQDGRGASGHIYAQRVDSGGAVKWATDGVPISTASGSQGGPRIVSDGSGRAIITWQDGRSGSGDIYAQRVDSSGNLSAPPVVATNAAANITTTSATLNGTLSSLGTASSVDVSFQWGTTPGFYTNETTAQEMTGPVSFFADLPGLTPNTPYYFRAKAVGDGTSYGDDEVSFRTGAGQGQVPSQVLSPVIGPLEVIGLGGTCSGTEWCFDQNRKSYDTPNGPIGHIPGGGVGHADDTYAWDANLNYPVSNLDAEQPVYAVAPGTVTDNYGGATNAGSGSYGQVLIEHTYLGSPWWSGYLHMTNIQVVHGQTVTQGTILGYISNVSPDLIPDHLHFVVYTGSNTYGGLVSFNAVITERTAPTPTGTDVTASTPFGSATLTGVSIEGTTRVTVSRTNPAGPTPANFNVRGFYADVTTTAVYTGPVTVGLRYDDSGVRNESRLRLFHWNGAAWQDATTSVDMVNNIIYGQVDSLSWFFIGEPIPPNTPVGSPVTVPLSCGAVTFDTVTVEGNTTCTSQQGNPGGGLPSGFRVQGRFTDVTTTATYTGPITVCLPYSLRTPYREAQFKLFHWDGNGWVDVTTSVDLVNHRVCGQVNSLSWFFIGDPSGTTGGCFIATAAYGSPMAKELDTFRAFRDQYLETNPIGHRLVRLYYRYSPPVAHFIDDHPALKPVARAMLTPPLLMAKVALNTTMTERVAIVASMALIGIQLALWFKRRRLAKA